MDSSSFTNLMAAESAHTAGEASVLLSPLFVVIAVLLTVMVIVGLLVAIVMMLRTANSRYAAPATRQLLLEAEERADYIVAEALEEARTVRAEIEKERLQALNEDKNEISLFIQAYHDRLDKAVGDLAYALEKEHMRAAGHFVDSLQNIEKKVAQNADDAKSSMDSFTTQSSALFERLANEIGNVERGIQHLAIALEEAASDEADKNANIVREEMRNIGETTARSVTEVAKGLDAKLRENLAAEFSSITQEIDAYRKARMDLIDERLLVLIEETAQIALQKKLSMSEHSELVFRALEEAKQRGVFV